MEISEKRKKLETLPWQALFDVAIEENIEEAGIKGNSAGERWARGLETLQMCEFPALPTQN